jgi:hypothetical protein
LQLSPTHPRSSEALFNSSKTGHSHYGLTNPQNGRIVQAQRIRSPHPEDSR